MKNIFLTVFIAAVLVVTHWMAYNEGQINVRTHTVVRFYAGVYHGSCQTEVWFAGERGMACATEPAPTKNPYCHDPDCEPSVTNIIPQ